MERMCFIISENKEYNEMVKRSSPRSSLLKNCCKAFVFGGGICTAGEGLRRLFILSGAEMKKASLLVSLSLIAITAVLTGIGVFDRIAKHAGAGTLVPITGFANSVAAPAVEFRTEGLITGTAVKMFSIAGPVIVYGTAAAFLYGVLYYCFAGGAV